MMEFQKSKSVRIRLCFEEQNMLNKVQVDQGLAKSWYLVDTNVLLSIGNLATRIALDYNLGQSCPHGISLEICGFVLPPSQSTRLLQDSDLVSVRRSQEGVSGGHSRELLTNSLSVDDEELRISTRYNKVGLRALEEFEKEAGGYESEYSEDEDPKVYLGVGNDVESAEIAKRMSKLKESNGKKGKRSSNIDTLQSKMLITPPVYTSRAAVRDLGGSDVQNRKSTRKEKIKIGAECTLEDGDGIGPLGSEKKKKKNKKGKLVEEILPNAKSSEDSEGRTSNAQEQRSGKKRTRKHKTDLEQVSLKPMEEEKTPCRNKRGENLSVLNGETGVTAEASQDRKKSKKRKDKNPVEVDEQDVQPKKKSSDKNNSNDGNALAVTEQTNSEEKRPSRSARRKKAKRRWLREQAQNGTLPKKEDVKENRKEEPDAESDTSEEVAVAVAMEVEVEAEEEILPVMVAPGHIRFEPDEDVGGQDQHAKPVLQLSANIRCKRQGQAWGQEKSYYDNHHESNGYGRSHEKREKKHLEQLAEIEMPAGDKIVKDLIQYEKFPVLNRVPQVGDVLAYKLVELTACWTPELSAYRVGKVSVYIETTRVVTLVPVPEYPIHVQQPEDYDGDAQQNDDDSFLPPYNPDGTLEVDLATLMEIRVLEDGPQSGAVAVQAQEAQKQELHNIGASTVNEGLLNSTDPVILQREPRQEDVEIAVAVQEASLTSEDLPQNDHGVKRSGQQTMVEGAESTLTIGLVEALEPNCETAWQDILSQDLNKKKLELAAKFSKQLSGGEGADPAGTPTPTSKPEALSNQDTKTGPGKKGIPQIRHRHMRTGALGPTMAMLRASQVL